MSMIFKYFTSNTADVSEGITAIRPESRGSIFYETLLPMYEALGIIVYCRRLKSQFAYPTAIKDSSDFFNFFILEVN
jgi:hypothetical protein